MLNRLADNLNLLVYFLDIKHQIFNIGIAVERIFKQPDSLEMAHLVNKGLTFYLWVNNYL